MCVRPPASLKTSTLMEVWQGGLSAATVDQIADNWPPITELSHASGPLRNTTSAEFPCGRAPLSNKQPVEPCLVERASLHFRRLRPDLASVQPEPDAPLKTAASAACFGLLRHPDLPCAATASRTSWSVRQFFDNGFQTEHPDPWMSEG